MTASISSTASPVIIATQPGGLPSVAAAAYIGVAPKTLSNWRARGEGPRFVRLGRSHARIVYRVSDLDQYLAEHLIGGDR